MGQAQVTVPLDIPDVRVLKTEINPQGDLIITVESTKPGTTCHRCGRWIDHLHGHDDWVNVRHLSVFGRPTYLRYRPRRYQCPNCQDHPTTTQHLDWREGGSPHTFAYDNHLLLQLVASTVEDVSQKERVRYDAVLGVMERRISAQVDWSAYNRLEVLGLDEIALKKGHRDFVTIVTARLSSGRLVILGVLADREKDTVIAFLRSIPLRLSQTIQSVCCDMYEGFTEAVREEVPSAQIVVDRFHLTRTYHRAADEERRGEMQRLKKSLSPEEYHLLKGSLWAFRKSADELHPEDRQVLKRLWRYAPRLKQAYEYREQLTAIFDQDLSKAAGQRKIRAWIRQIQQSGLHCYDDFLKTLEHWWEEITNYFLARENSGFVEGFNNKLKVLKRRCYGIFNLAHLFQRLFLDLEGYHLFAP
jgi:transposase